MRQLLPLHLGEGPTLTCSCCAAQLNLQQLNTRVEQRLLDPVMGLLNSTVSKPDLTRIIAGQQLLKCLVTIPVDSWEQGLKK